MKTEILILVIYSSFWMLWIYFWLYIGFKKTQLNYEIKNIFDVFFKLFPSVITSIGLKGVSKKSWYMIIFGIFMLIVSPPAIEYLFKLLN